MIPDDNPEGSKAPHQATPAIQPANPKLLAILRSGVSVNTQAAALEADPATKKWLEGVAKGFEEALAHVALFHLFHQT
jgi:hypothetical protein